MSNTCFRVTYYQWENNVPLKLDSGHVFLCLGQFDFLLAGQELKVI